MTILRCSPLLILIGLIIGFGYIPYSSGSNLVHVTDGATTYAGSCDSSICSWFGIRYAAAPVGELRFAPPQAPATLPTRQKATVKGASCPQSGSTHDQDEDCLFLNIQRPKIVNLAIKLPTLIFIHGGGFETGSGNANDPSAMIALGADNNQSAVVVRINYRLGLLGFLASTEMQSMRDSNAIAVGLNNGFQDIKMAIDWVQEHISAFGGDPSRVTIWGQSAGSFGASAQMMAHPDTAPFQAAILESGSPGGVPIDPVSAKDAQYQRVLQASGCLSSSNHIKCLQSKSWKEMRDFSLKESSRAMQPSTLARGFYAWTSVIDGGPSKGGFFTSSPSSVINSGAFAKVPILQGDCLDEGTIFAPHTFDDTSDLSTWLQAVYFTNLNNTSPSEATTLLNSVLQAYPDDSTIGSPYNPVGAASSDRFYGATNQYKRAASIYGDIRYQSNRRLWLSAASRNVNAYSYIYAQENSGNAASLGVPHGSDLNAVLQSPSNPISQILARQFLAFATSYDPSSSPGLPAWPSYTASQPILLQYQNGAVTQIQDTFRSDAIDLLNSQQVLDITGR